MTMLLQWLVIFLFLCACTVVALLLALGVLWIYDRISEARSRRRRG